ncbi:MAG TPA: hypothetical protein VGN80_19145 [Devosiaceae bacterium]|jgi:hypothetical protein|nr:hypothetical protein [Devosiaceae bacterium]
MTLEEIDAALVELRAAKQARLLGNTTTKVGYSDGSAEFAVSTLSEINGEIARLEVARSRLTGCRSGLGPIRPGFGGRL